MIKIDSSPISTLDQKRTLQRDALILLAVVVTFFYAELWFSYLYLGTCSRFHADDYIFYDHYLTRGPVQNVVQAYCHWSGRYSWLILTNFVTNTSFPHIGAIVPGLLVAWLSGSYVLLSRWRVPPFVGTVALMVAQVTALTLDRQSNQAVYWFCAATGYLAPFALLPVVIALALRQDQRLVSLITVGTIAFVAAGFNEMISVGLCLLLVALVLITKPRTQGLFSALCGAIVGTLVVALSPGNASRAALEVAHGNVKMSWLGAARLLPEQIGYYIGILTHGPYLVGLLLVAGAVCAVCSNTKPERSMRGAVLSVGVGAVIVTLMSLIGIYATKQLLATRLLFAPEVALATTLVVLGWHFGASIGPTLRSNPIRIAAAATIAAVLFVLPLPSLLRQSENLQESARAYSIAWDRQDAALRVQPTIAISPLDTTNWFSGERADQTNWPTISAAIHSIYERSSSRH